MQQVRAATKRPINVNFFCHTMPKADAEEDQRWRQRLADYYRELGLDPEMPSPPGGRTPFDANFCAWIEEAKPEAVTDAVHAANVAEAPAVEAEAEALAEAPHETSVVEAFTLVAETAPEAPLIAAESEVVADLLD